MHGNINPIILVYFKLEACASIKVYLNIILYYICPPQLEIIDITVIRDCNISWETYMEHSYSVLTHPRFL